MKPLITELHSAHRQNDEDKEKICSLTGYVRMLSAILKFPNLCEKYHRIYRARQHKKESIKSAVHTLRQYDLDDNPSNVQQKLEKLQDDIED